MTTDRHQRGLDTLMEYTLTGNPDISTRLKIAEYLQEFAPDGVRYITEFACGDKNRLRSQIDK